MLLQVLYSSGRSAQERMIPLGLLQFVHKIIFFLVTFPFANLSFENRHVYCKWLNSFAHGNVIYSGKTTQNIQTKMNLYAVGDHLIV